MIPFWRHCFCFQDYFDCFQFVLAVFPTVEADFYNVLIFYSGGRLVWVCQHLRLQYCGSQYLFLAHQVLPNHSTLIPFLGV